MDVFDHARPRADTGHPLASPPFCLLPACSPGGPAGTLRRDGRYLRRLYPLPLPRHPPPPYGIRDRTPSLTPCRPYPLPFPAQWHPSRSSSARRGRRRLLPGPRVAAAPPTGASRLPRPRHPRLRHPDRGPPLGPAPRVRRRRVGRPRRRRHGRARRAPPPPPPPTPPPWHHGQTVGAAAPLLAAAGAAPAAAAAVATTPSPLPPPRP